MSQTDPAIAMVRQCYNFIKQRHGKTRVMVSALRSKQVRWRALRAAPLASRVLTARGTLSPQDIFDLAGVDFMVLSERIKSTLSSGATDQG